jgi:hypothetical protein
MTITNPDYVNAFGNGNTGALISRVLLPWHGFGKFILVLLSLSVVGTYSRHFEVLCQPLLIELLPSQQHS